VPIKKEIVAEVVAEASQKMNDPNYSAVLVGGFVQLQTPIVQFVSAHEQELGGAEGIVSVIFHAALINTAFTRGVGRTTRMISFDDLDSVAGPQSMAKLEKTQPFIHGFIEENVENPDARKLLALIALAMDR
jgi:hypothetical protein